MVSHLPQRMHSGMNQSPQGTKSPQEVQTHISRTGNEEEAECSGVIAIATHAATTLISCLGPEN